MSTTTLAEQWVKLVPPWRTSEDVDQLAPALVDALGQLEDVARTRTASMGTYQYRYADLAAVLERCRKVLAACGLAVSQVANVADGQVVVSTTLWHSSGQWLLTAPVTLAAGQTAQQTGSAITYARRYGLMAVLGLATEDDDGAAAGEARPTEQQLMSQANLDRFRAAAGDLGLDLMDIEDVVHTATGGRTSDLEQVWGSEVAALREALEQHGRRESTPGVSQPPGPGESEASRPAPDTPGGEGDEE